MSLRRKTLLIVLAVTVSLTVLVYGMSQTVVARSFQELEEQTAGQNVQVVMNALDDELSFLSATTRDYAGWDDSYTFMDDRNAAFIMDNFTDESIVNLKVNLVAFINAAGETIFIKAVDLRSGSARDVPAGIEAYLSGSRSLLDLTDAGKEGIILLAEGPMLVASQPVTDSLRAQPPRGSLVFGEFLDDVRIQALSDSLRLPIQLRPVSDPQLPADFQAARASGAAQFVQPLSNDQTAGYGLINDLSGSPALLLRVDMARDISARGQTSTMLFMGLFAAAGIVFGVLTVLLLERSVLSRLTGLSAGMNQISGNGNLAARVDVTGTDELSTLAADVNTMLQALEKAQSRQRDSDQQLRSIVNGAPLLLWASDNSGKTTLLEGKSLELLGLGSTHDTGKPVIEVFRNIPQFITDIGRALKGEEFGSLVVVKELVFDVRYVPTRGLDGLVTGMVGVATNITERVMAEEALTTAYEDLTHQNRQLERAQELFRVTLDHIAQTVQRGASTEEITQYLEFVQSEFSRVG